MKKHFLLTLMHLCIGLSLAFAQTSTPRSLTAKRTTKPVIIDGKLNDLAWQDAAIADDYTEFRPTAGRKEEKGNHTRSAVGTNALPLGVAVEIEAIVEVDM